MLVVDDHDMVHRGVRAVLGEQPWVERCLAARDTSEALELARRYDPHVALVDLFVGTESGAAICGALRAASPRTRVLLISGVGQISPHAARAAGASGFISKATDADAVAEAILAVARGGSVFGRDEEGPAGTVLSARERAVLEGIASGATNAEIGRRLHLSPNTVKDNARALYRKLKVRNRAEAVRRAQRLGLIP